MVLYHTSQNANDPNNDNPQQWESQDYNSCQRLPLGQTQTARSTLAKQSGTLNSRYTPLKSRHSKVSQFGLLTIFILLSLVQIVAAQNKVALIFAGVGFQGSDYVSTQTKLSFDLTKRSDGSPWQTDKCFQVQFSAEYTPQSGQPVDANGNIIDFYQPFDVANPPICTAHGTFTMECNLKPGTTNTIQFQFKSFTGTADQQPKIDFFIDKFQTPYSTVEVQTNVIWYNDADCSTESSQLPGGSLTFSAVRMTKDDIKITSSNNQVGFSGIDNAMILSFTPGAPLAPSKRGMIDVTIPDWYNIDHGTKQAFMYSESAEDKCSSDELTIQTSKFGVGNLRIAFVDVKDGYLSGKQIQIKCLGFKNPIVPDDSKQFRLKIRDWEKNDISISAFNELNLDATSYSPVILPPSNFKITVMNPTVGSYSQWVFNLDVNVPLEKGCFFKVLMPNDLSTKFKSVQVSKIFKSPRLKSALTEDEILTFSANNDPTNPDNRAYVVINGCNDDNSLGEAPSGRMVYADFAMPRAVKASEPFNIQIYKDELLTQLIAEMTDGVRIEKTAIAPGPLNGVTIAPGNAQVQKVTDMAISFSTSHRLEKDAMIEIRMPGSLTLSGPPGTEIDIDSYNEKTQETKTLKGKIVKSGQHIQIYNVLENFVGDSDAIPEDEQFKLTIKEIQNQNSAKDAGDWEVTTYLKISDQYFQVDNAKMPKSFTAQTGSITSSEGVEVSNAVVYGKNSIYTLKFQCENSIPANGFIQVVLPPQIQIDVNTVKSKGTCASSPCTEQTDSTKIQYLITTGTEANEVITIKIGGVTNPRSMQVTDDFVITTLDTDGISQIDQGYNKQAGMTSVGEIQSIMLNPTSDVNGQVNTYTFTMYSDIPLKNNDQLKFTFPQQIVPPSSAESMNCLGESYINEVTCEIVGQNAIATMKNVTWQPGGGGYAFTVSNISNPYSVETSTGFSQIVLTTKNPSFDIAEFKGANPSKPGETKGITNAKAAPILKYNATQNDLSPNAITELTISFTPINALPSTGTVEISYPQQLGLQDGDNTPCTVTTNGNSIGSQYCTILTRNRLITIQGVFSSSDPLGRYGGPVIVQLKNIKNPPNNKNMGSYMIQSYADKQQEYIVDQLDSGKLFLDTECRYPCLQCSASDKQHCSSCWDDGASGGADPGFLMDNGTISTCKTGCDAGYSANKNVLVDGEQKVCLKCDDSCNNCFEQSIFDCVECNKPTYPFRLTHSSRCLTHCSVGFYQSTDSTCGKCNDPCKDCEGLESNCTLCHSDKVLYRNQCINKCPAGFTSVNGICTECISPCGECNGDPNKCLECDGTNLELYLFNQTCHQTCPSGSTANKTNSYCMPCSGTGCSLCKLDALDCCLQCKAPLVVYECQCASACPEGFVMNDDKTACRTSQLEDLGILYFPFLITGSVFTLVVLLGKLKKKAILVKGKVQKISYQSSITTILVFLAPLQALATIAQWVLAYLYNTMTHMYLAMCVTVIILIVNFAFVWQFNSKFRTMRLTKEAQDKIKRKKLTTSDAKKNPKFNEVADHRFEAWYKRHKGIYWGTFFMSLLSFWKVNKILYSRFYNYGLFTAYWTKAKEYRNFINWYGLITMIVVDLFLICIGITGLLHIPWNQLFITFIETVVLSIVNIVLGSIELYRLQDYLEYTMDKEKRWQQRVASGYDDQDMLDRESREQMMRGLIAKVKGNKDIFLNNKLDELLNEFGDRKCKSMINLSTGWPKEEDPREIVTWPLTPSQKAEYDYEIKFTKDDAYGKQDNCYFESVTKHPGKDKALQGDPSNAEFQDALNRKHGDLMTAQEDPVDDQRRLGKNKRRGRKNKYYAQIDQEDDEEADAVEASDEDKKADDLQIIKEQEEEEENLRKMVQAEAAKQAQEADARRKKQELEAQQKLESEKAKAEAAAAQAARDKAEKEAKDKSDKDKLSKEDADREKLKKEAEDEQKKRDADKLAKDLANKNASELARLQYEADEAEKLRKQADDAAKKAAEDAAAQALLDAAAKKAAEDAAKAAKPVEVAPKPVEVAPKPVEAVVLPPPAIVVEKTVTVPVPVIDPIPVPEARQKTPEVVPVKTASAAPEKPPTPQVKEEGLKEVPAQADPIIQHPPNWMHRLFNENDILGDLDRDEKGNVVVLTDQNGNHKDRAGNPTNQRGYLVDPKTGDLIDNLDNQVMFPKTDLDEKGEVPAPFCVEKFNFNPHNIMGDFDYVDGKPRMMVTNKGFFVDKKGRRVNKHGWMVLAGQGHLVDKHGRKKFDKRQLTNEGDIPKLYTLTGKRYDIKDTMGQFDKDPSGNIILLQKPNGDLQDKEGRPVNNKGYLIDKDGNIIDCNDKFLFPVGCLLSNEFPKIFPFTKFNPKKVTGDFEMNPSGIPILDKAPDGTLLDRQKRPVNGRGYLIDPQGNVIDDRDNIMFSKQTLEDDGEIPAVFRTGLLKQSSGSSLSRLMDEIERNQPSEYDNQEENKVNADPDYQMLRKDEGDTSVDSKMEDTPANYNMANQRFDPEYDDAQGVDPIEEDPEKQQDDSGKSEDEEPGEMPLKKKPKKKKKPKTTTIEFLEPTTREVNMAGAYGGAARGQIRRPGIKYEKERLNNAKKFRVNTAEEPKVRATLERLAKSVSGFNPATGQPKATPGVPKTKHNTMMGQTGFDSQGDARSQRSGAKSRTGTDKPDSQAAIQQMRDKGKKSGKKGLKDQDFEKMFGKDIDQFLEDSEWDIESQFDDKASHASKTSGRSNAQEKLKAIEKLYLARLDNQGNPAPGQGSNPKLNPSKSKTGPNRPMSNQKAGGLGRDSSLRKPKKIKPDPGPPRETIISFTDDPGVIHRGEILPFHTKKLNDKRGSRGPSAIGIGGDSLSSQHVSPDRSSWKQ